MRWFIFMESCFFLPHMILITFACIFCFFVRLQGTCYQTLCLLCGKLPLQTGVINVVRHVGSIIPQILPLHVLGQILNRTSIDPFNVCSFSPAERWMSYLPWQIKT